VTEAETKAKWKGTQPYPTWPFGTVQPKEMARYVRRQEKQTKEQERNECDEAPF
jgi:hypothetical protein